MAKTFHSCRLLLLLLLGHLVLVCSSKDGGFRRLFGRKPPPEHMADRAAREAAQLGEQGLKAVEKRRSELEREVKRLSNDINQAARQKGSELKDAALQQAQAKKQTIEREVQRLTQEAENLTRERAGAAERAARDKLVELEKAATAEAQRLAQVADTLTATKAAEAEEVARRKLAALEKTATDKVTTFVDRLIYGTKAAPKKLLSAAVADGILNALRGLVLLTSLGNLLGPKPVLELWDTKGFGDEFFPFDVSVNKRILAATLEFVGLLLLLVADERVRLAGAGMIALLFGRGSWLHAKREVWQIVLFPGVVTVLAVTLLVNELVPAPQKTTNSRKKHLQ